MNVFKGERFWLALIAMALVGGLSIAGRISGGEGVSALMALLAGFGVGRGASDNKAVKSLFPLMMVAMLATSCASSPVGAIDKSVKAIQLASDIVMPLIHAQCMAEAKACAAKGDKTCQAWETCNGNREIFRLSIDATQEGLAKAALIAEQVCKKGGCN